MRFLALPTEKNMESTGISHNHGNSQTELYHFISLTFFASTTMAENLGPVWDVWPTYLATVGESLKKYKLKALAAVFPK